MLRTVLAALLLVWPAAALPPQVTPPQAAIAGGATADTLPSAQAWSGTDGVILFQPSNTAAPNGLAQGTPDQAAAYIGAHLPRIPTLVANATTVLDTTYCGKTLLITDNTTIQAPSLVGNLGPNSGDGCTTRFLNPDGYQLTFASNGGNSIVVPGGLTTSTAVGIYDIAVSAVSGGTRIVASLPSTGGSTLATAFTTTLSATTGTVGVSVNMTISPVGIWPASVTATPSVSGCSGTWSPTSGSPTGGSTTPVVFALTPSTAGTCILSATATGMTNSSGSRSYASTAAPLAISAIVPQAVGTVSASLVFNATYTGTWSTSGLSCTIDGSAATISANSAGSGGVGTLTFTAPATSGAHTLACSGAGSASTDFFANSTGVSYMAGTNYGLTNGTAAYFAGDGFRVAVGDGTNNGKLRGPSTVGTGLTNLTSVVVGWSKSPFVPPAALFPGAASYSNQGTLSLQSGYDFYRGDAWPYVRLAGTWYGMVIITDGAGNKYLLSSVSPVVAN